jgi:CdiI immunity protein
MVRILQELCELYIQDFELVFEEPTDPIDMFCQQHSLEDQEALLNELKKFLQEAVSGTKSIMDLVEMGLEYIPGVDHDPRTWLPALIEYLSAKIAESKQTGGNM